MDTAAATKMVETVTAIPPVITLPEVSKRGFAIAMMPGQVTCTTETSVAYTHAKEGERGIVFDLLFVSLRTVSVTVVTFGATETSERQINLTNPTVLEQISNFVYLRVKRDGGLSILIGREFRGTIAFDAILQSVG